MKKALAMALGAVLAAGAAAAPASATEIDVSGFYRAMFINNGNMGMTSEDNLDESWFNSRLRLNVNFQATDAVSVHWRFQAPGGKRWGAGTHSDSLQSRFYYGQVVQDWGTVRVGKLPNGPASQFGLYTLGWNPLLDNQFTSIAPFDGSVEPEGIQYTNTWDNGFTVKAAYAKVGTIWNGASINHISNDHDYDRFYVEGAYQWEGGGAALNVMYDRDARGDGFNGAGSDGLIGTADDVAAYKTLTAPLQGDRDKTAIWYLNPAVMHAWGGFSFHAEAKFGFGETTDHNNSSTLPANRDKDVDAEGQGYYLDFDYNYGPGRVNLAGWWVSGNEYNDKDNNAIVDIVDGMFYPLVVAYGPVGYPTGNSYDSRLGYNYGALGAVNVANNSGYLIGRGTADTVISTNAAAANMKGKPLEATDSSGNRLGDNNLSALSAVQVAAIERTPKFNERNRSTANANGNANHWAMMLSGQHAFTDAITMNYALAYMALNNPNYSVMDRASLTAGNVARVGYHTQDKEIGWEIDLGVNVQLLDNLAFTSTFGYLFTGDAYQSLKGYHVDRAGNGDLDIKAQWEDADDAYSWVNSLVFSF